MRPCGRNLFATTQTIGTEAVCTSGALVSEMQLKRPIQPCVVFVFAKSKEVRSVVETGAHAISGPMHQSNNPTGQKNFKMTLTTALVAANSNGLLRNNYSQQTVARQ